MLVQLTERARGPAKTGDSLRYVKVFISPPTLAEADAPDIGDLMSGASGVMGARVVSVDPRPDVQNSRTILVVTYDALVAYSGGDATELAKSRYRSETDPEHGYVRRWAWNGTDAMPVAVGDSYPDSLAGVGAIVCVKVDVQRDWNALRHLVTANYSQMR